MSSAARFITYCLDRPRTVTTAMAVITVLLIVAATLPSVAPERFPYLHGVSIDTDPENMLDAGSPVRRFHEHAKHEFSLWDMVVVGVVNDADPDGVFNPESLARVFELTRVARGLQWDDPAHPSGRAGVIEADMLAPSMVDSMEQGGLGVVKFDWLMPVPPQTRTEARAVRERAQRIPFLNGTLVSEDGRALALYLPITSKDVSYRIRSELLAATADWPADDQVYITGLPVAEDTFGVEMFYQMAISAPLAMLVIFLLLWWFFRKLILIASPMILAMVASLSTMALLVITGHTVHIMTSMIPIFIMPIAVLDAVHILSEFFDRYPVYRDRRRTLESVMETLFKPMLFTSLTTIAGFASLVLTPIPPVQTFGVFIAIGVLMAWFWTIAFIPAYIMLIPESRLQGYGHHASAGEADTSLMGRVLTATGGFTQRRRSLVFFLVVACIFTAGFGISRIVINDNPTKWFTYSHPIRVADRVLNDHFGGTYMAYLELAVEDTGAQSKAAASDIMGGLSSRLAAEKLDGAEDVVAALSAASAELGSGVTSAELLQRLKAVAAAALDGAGDNLYYTWEEAALYIDAEIQRGEVFKRPDLLRYIESLQNYLASLETVGKSNSIVDIVKTVHRELFLGEAQAFRVPDTANAVGQTLITYEGSHRPHDLWHFVTPDFDKGVVWLQLTSGDNRDMQRVARAVDAYLNDHPPPVEMSTNWFGLTYINVVWQREMVRGMGSALLGSFGVVLLMMIGLFRSFWWGLLSMVPLTITVGLIYGIIGIIGKEYDMPVAVLSSLSLGLAVDFSIHFLARARASYAECGNWRDALEEIFQEPARAITRNAIILGAGFLPLLAAPLTPYKTVGVFIAAIIFLAGAATMVILPAALGSFERLLFGTKSKGGQQ